MFKKNIVGKNKFVVVRDDGTIFGGLHDDPSEAFESMVGSLMGKDGKRVVEVNIIRELTGHICFCKQDHCCCPKER